MTGHYLLNIGLLTFWKPNQPMQPRTMKQVHASAHCTFYEYRATNSQFFLSIHYNLLGFSKQRIIKTS